jgi:hypothetical protein
MSSTASPCRRTASPNCSNSIWNRLTRNWFRRYNKMELNLSVNASRTGFPSSNLSVCFADSSPGRGASGEEEKLSEMPKPPLGRGGGTALAVTERLSPNKTY